MHPILLYDGVCGLCNRLVQFVLRRDAAGVFRFASLQSELAQRILARHGMDARDLDSVYVVLDSDQPGESVLARSDAVIFILRHLRAEATTGGPAPFTAKGSVSGFAFWRVLGFLLPIIPRRLRDLGYRIIARNRYRIFGRYDSCPIPTEETRSRFLDL